MQKNNKRMRKTEKNTFEMKTYKEVNKVSVSGDGDSIEKKDFKNKSKAEKNFADLEAKKRRQRAKEINMK